MALRGKAKREIQAGVDKLEEFTCGNVSGRRGAYGGTGRLPADLARGLREAQAEGRLEYVLYSYWTPMAWRIDGEWTFPDESYSATTSNHQGVMRTAISNPGLYTDARW